MPETVGVLDGEIQENSNSCLQEVGTADISTPEETNDIPNANGVSSGMQLHDRSKLKKPEHYSFVAESDFSAVFEPESYKEAVKGSNAEKWKKAMSEEMQQLKSNGTWELAELPEGKTAVANKWVYKVKNDGQFRARLVAKGYSQRFGVDYKETYSPVARCETVRTLLSFVAKNCMKTAQFDVTTALLNAELTDEIYMQQPEGFSDGTKEYVG